MSGAGEVPPLPASQVQRKVRQYEAFVNDVLKEDLKRAQKRKAELQQEIHEYEQLELNCKQVLEDGCQPLTLQVDLGAEVLAEAHVPDPSLVYVSIGLGFHVGVELADVPRVVGIRKEALRKQLDEAMEQVAKIRMHIRMTQEALAQLMQLSASK